MEAIAALHSRRSQARGARTWLPAVAACMLAVGAHAATTYTVIDLSALQSNGYAGLTISSAPFSMNNKGLLLGTATHAATGAVSYVVFDPVSRIITPIATPIVAGVAAAPATINNSGQILAASGTTLVIVNADGTQVDLGTAPVPAGESAITAVQGLKLTDSGIALAVRSLASIFGSACPGGDRDVVTATAAGGMKPFGGLGAVCDMGTGINASGQVSGYGETAQRTGIHAFVGTNGVVKDLHARSLGQSSVAWGINDVGTVVGAFDAGTAANVMSCSRGRCWPAMVTHAVTWNAATGAYKDLSPAGATSSLNAINNNGDVVGLVQGPTAPAVTAYGWAYSYTAVGHSAASTLTDVNTLISNPIANMMLKDGAYGISDGGHIYAMGTVTDPATNAVAHKLVLLTPSGTTGGGAAPAAPSALAASAPARQQVHLSWADNANNEASFELERCSGNNCTNFSRIAAPAANVASYDDTNVRSGRTYSYRLRAVNASGNSAYSNVAKATAR